MRFFDLRTDRSRCKQNERSTSRALECHLRVLPQWLVDDSLDRAERGAYLRGKATHLLEPDRLRFRSRRARPKECGPSLRRLQGQAPRRRSRMLETLMKACANVGRSFGSSDAKSRMTTQSEHRCSELHLTLAEAGDGCFLDALRVTEVTNAASKLPCRRRSASRVNPRGFHRGEDERSTSRSRCARAPSPGGCLPLMSHQGGPRAQDTQRECDDISHGVRILSAFEPRRSLHRFTSPAPSALGVSHSLSGLSPPGPRGFVSRHIRP
jgi:hypothetical protein